LRKEERGGVRGGGGGKLWGTREGEVEGGVGKGRKGRCIVMEGVWNREVRVQGRSGHEGGRAKVQEED